MIECDWPAVVAVGGFFEAASLTCHKTVIAHQPGDPVASCDDIIGSVANFVLRDEGRLR
jgi:hypothetical protein